MADTNDILRARNGYIWFLVAPFMVLATTLVIASMNYSYSICISNEIDCGRNGAKILNYVFGLLPSALWYAFLFPNAFHRESAFVRKHGWRTLAGGVILLGAAFLGLLIDWLARANSVVLNITFAVLLVIWLVYFMQYKKFVKEHTLSATDPLFVEQSLNHLKSGDPLERRMAVLDLGRAKSLETVPELIEAAQDSDSIVRQNALDALRGIESAEARQFLEYQNIQPKAAVETAIKTGLLVGLIGTPIALIAAITLIVISLGGLDPVVIFASWVIIGVLIILPFAIFCILGALIGAFIGRERSGTKEAVRNAAIMGLIVGAVIFSLLFISSNSLLDPFIGF